MTGERPPGTRIAPVLDHFYGVPVEDPYRWLESNGDPEVQAWTDAQNALTRRLLDPPLLGRGSSNDSPDF